VHHQRPPGAERAQHHRHGAGQPRREDAHQLAPRAAADSLKGGDAEANAAALKGVLLGKPSPYRDVALLNAGAALIVAGRAKDLKEAVELGAKSIDSGAAAGRLAKLIAVSNTVTE
jgi:anthranilate phosphoribosyltransferase